MKLFTSFRSLPTLDCLILKTRGGAKNENNQKKTCANNSYLCPRLPRALLRVNTERKCCASKATTGMSTATVLVVDTFRCRSASGVDSDLFYRFYEQHVNQLLERALNAALNDYSVFVFVSCYNGSALARPLTGLWPRGSRKAQPNLVELLSEPLPRLHQGPTSLHVLASALGSLEVVLPCESNARVLFLSPWHASQNDAEDGEDWTSVLEEIQSYLIPENGTKSARVKSCDFFLVEMQQSITAESSLEKSCLSRLQTFNSARCTTSQISPFSTKVVSATDDAFNDLFRQITSWMFEPRAVQIHVDPRSKSRFGHAEAAETAMTTLTIFGNISPAAWTTLSWWHSGLSRMNAMSIIPLSQVDPLRLSAALSLAPITTTDGMQPKLPQSAVTENRCLFAALCQEIAVSDCGLLLSCSSSPEFCGHDEIWLLHCDRASSPLQNASIDAKSLENEGVSPRAWESAIMQQILPNEVLLQPVDAHQPLTASDCLCIQSYAAPVRSALSALGELRGLPCKSRSTFDESPSTIGSTGLPLNLRAAYTSPWLHQYHLSPSKGPEKQLPFSSINQDNVSGKDLRQPHQRVSNAYSMPQQHQEAKTSPKMSYSVPPSAGSLRQNQPQQELQQRHSRQPGRQSYQHHPQLHGNVQLPPRSRESQHSPPKYRPFSSLSSERNMQLPGQKKAQNSPASHVRVGRSYDLTQDEDFDYDALEDLSGPASNNNLPNSWGSKAPKVINKRSNNAAPGKLPLSFGFLGNK